MALADGYWFVICDEIMDAKKTDDLVYFSNLNSSESLYSSLRDDLKLRE